MVSSPAESASATGVAADAPRSLWSPLPLVIAFTVGALALLQIPALPSPRLLLAGLAAAALPAVFRVPYRWPWLALVAGAAWTALQAQAVIATRWPVERLGETMWVEGVIASLPQGRVVSDAADADPRTETEAPAGPLRDWRFRFDPRSTVSGAGVSDLPAQIPTQISGQIQGQIQGQIPGQIPSHLRVAWYRSEQVLRGGECWRLKLVLRTPHGSFNPGGFDYEGWLFRQRIGATATVRAGEPCAASRSHYVLRLRQALADRLATWLPEHPALPLVAALSFGDTSGLAEEDWQAFRQTGTTHLVAISGFNVAIVSGLIFFLLRWAWSRSARLCLHVPAARAATIGAACAALIYALLAGFEAPVQRAALMVLVLAAAQALGGLARPQRALALAWLVIVIGDPLSLLSPGLWLSFAAVAAIFYATVGRLQVAPAWRIALHLQLMLSLLLAPLSLYWFQGSSLTGPLVNLVLVPIVAVLTPALLAALLLSALLPALGLPLLRLLADLLASGQQALGWIAEHTAPWWFAASPSAGALLLAMLGAVLLFAPRGLPVRLLGALCCLALMLPPGRAVESGFRMTVFDVGQGLAVLVQTRSHALLFDAGPAWPGGFDSGESIVVPGLLHAGVQRLDRLILSHGDRDHVGGAAAVRAAIPIVRETGAITKANAGANVGTNAGASAGATEGDTGGLGRAEPCRSGERWEWDDVEFQMLAGPQAEDSDNDGSCVLRIVHAGHAALLTGDIEAVAEARLLETQVAALRADVLIAPHHGSRTSSTPAFVAAVQPALVIHSAGWHHRYHHPAREVVERYAASGAQQLATGDSGAVTVTVDRRGTRAVTARAASPRLWHTPGDEQWRRAASLSGN